MEELRNVDLVDVGRTRATVVAVEVERCPSATVHESACDSWIAVVGHDKEPFSWQTQRVSKETRADVSANDVLRLEEVHRAIVCHCRSILRAVERIAQLRGRREANVIEIGIAFRRSPATEPDRVITSDVAGLGGTP
jgi:hypothetical protein